MQRQWRSSGKRKEQDETQFTTKIDGFFEFHPRLNANVLFLQVFVESHLVYDQTQGSGAVFLLLYGELYWESGSKVQTIKKIGFESQP